ncbi:MAG: metal ABC transporter solute-binding protein, Zn/Mn family [Limisphaerales bacterium]
MNKTQALLAAVAALALTGCQPKGDGHDHSGHDHAKKSDQPSAGPSAYPFKTVATVGMIADIVRVVAGEHAEVNGLIGEGVDPHLYKPTASNVKALQGADIVFYNGLMLEGKMGDVLVRVASSGKPVHAVTEAILNQGDYVMTDEAEHYDPHVWMDVQGWIKAVEVVRDSLAKFDAKNASSYQGNAIAYIEQLNSLNDYAKKALGSIPKSQRVLVTAHDAFNYLARAYGLEVRGIQGISTESEAGVKDIENLVDLLVKRKIPAVFVESSVSAKNINALIEGAKARGADVKKGGELFSDAMGETGTYEGTYLGMIDHNVTTIARALGGEAPEKGWQGKLSH